MILTISEDGAVRIDQQSLAALRLVHLVSGIDPASAARGANWAAPMTGYTEWISTAPAGVTIGWDWQMHVDTGACTLRRVGAPRSNLMLDDNIVKDVSQSTLSEWLCHKVDGHPWQADTETYLRQRYDT